jgi:tripartite-type tricarboxylate transporter receptor subunit TctC
MSEAGYPGFVLTPWFGLLAPAKVPEPVLAKLNAAFNEALNDPAVRKRLAEIDLDHAGGSGAEYGALIRSESERWGRLIRDKNIKAE